MNDSRRRRSRMSKTHDFHNASARELAAVLKSTELSHEQLQFALANAMDRVAALEKNWEELGEICRMVNDQISAAEIHGHGLLKSQ